MDRLRCRDLSKPPVFPSSGSRPDEWQSTSGHDGQDDSHEASRDDDDDAGDGGDDDAADGGDDGDDDYGDGDYDDDDDGGDNDDGYSGFNPCRYWRQWCKPQRGRLCVTVTIMITGIVVNCGGPQRRPRRRRRRPRRHFHQNEQQAKKTKQICTRMFSKLSLLMLSTCPVQTKHRAESGH